MGEGPATGVPSARAFLLLFALPPVCGGGAGLSPDLRMSARIRRARGDAAPPASRLSGDAAPAWTAAFLSCDIVMTRLLLSLLAGTGEERSGGGSPAVPPRPCGAPAAAAPPGDGASFAPSTAAPANNKNVAVADSRA
jgi:hypothetical protein